MQCQFRLGVAVKRLDELVVERSHWDKLSERRGLERAGEEHDAAATYDVLIKASEIIFKILPLKG